MPLYPSDAQLKKERQTALRNFRALLRHLDTKLEKLQRVTDRLAALKTRMEIEQANAIVDPWEDLKRSVAVTEKGAVDFLGVFY
jgi:hypothetical protein